MVFFLRRYSAIREPNAEKLKIRGRTQRKSTKDAILDRHKEPKDIGKSFRPHQIAIGCAWTKKVGLSTR